MMGLKPKSIGNTVYTDAVRNDWARTITMHNENFDAILYRPSIDQTEVDEPNTALFGDANERQKDIKYQDPILVSAVESDGEESEFLAAWDGEQSVGYGESGSIILRLSEFNVAEGSIIEFLVALAGGDAQRQYWYVQRSSAIGNPAVGFVHYCIPCGDIAQLPEPTGGEQV